MGCSTAPRYRNINFVYRRFVLQKLPVPGKLRAFRRDAGGWGQFEPGGDEMNARFMAITTICVGMVAGSLAFPLGEMILQPVQAEDSVITIHRNQPITAASASAKKRSSVTFTLNSAPPTVQAGLILTGVIDTVFRPGNSAPATSPREVVTKCEASSSDITFTEPVKIRDGGFNVAPLMSDSVFEPKEIGWVSRDGIQVNTTTAVSVGARFDGIHIFTPSNVANLGETGSGYDLKNLAGSVRLVTDTPATLVGLAEPQQLIFSGNRINFGEVGHNYNIVLTTSAQTFTESSTSHLEAQFVELSNQLAKLKLKRMKAESLAMEIAALKKEISDQEAAAKLEEAQEQLKKIMNEHPDRPAALNAKRMLDSGVGSPNTPGFQPQVNSLPTY